MAQKKDSKGRNLRPGELQEENGRYRFRYTDATGSRRIIRSWKLVPTDRTPAGKKDGLSLRELEKEIEADNMDGINTAAALKITVNEMFERYMNTKTGLKERTRNLYIYMHSLYIKNEIGQRKISKVKYSEVRSFYNGLLQEGLSLATVKIINSFMRPTFALAVRDSIIRSNPTDGALTGLTQEELKKERHALTVQEQMAFIDFIRESNTYNKYLPLFTFFLGTGCRVGEVIGLTWKDCDFEAETISINHTLAYTRQESGKSENHITKPKTKGSIRIIPMFKDVKAALVQEHTRQQERGFNPVILDGYGGFVFTNSEGNTYSRQEIGRIIRSICAAYNKAETAAAQKEGRTPALIRDFTPHDLRHTFATRLCESDVNIKVIQSIMGHVNISTTMDVYAEATENKKKEAFRELEGKFKIS